MKRNYLLLVLTLSCLCVFIFYACRKPDEASWISRKSNKEAVSVSKAEAWYTQKHAADIEIMKELEKKTGQRMSSLSSGSFAGIPDWSQYHENAEGSINVAMCYGYFSNTEKVYFRDLVVSYDEDGYLQELIEQVEFDSAYLKHQIGVMGIQEHLRSYIDRSNFTGKVSLYGICNQLLKSAVFENGELKHYLASSSKGMGIASTVGGRTSSPVAVYSAAGGEVVTDPDLPDVILPPGRKPNPGGGGFWWPPFTPLPPPPPLPPGPGPGYGGGGMPPPPPSDDPCEKAAKVGKHATTKSLMRELSTKTRERKEYGYVLVENNGKVSEFALEGDAGTGKIEISLTGKIDGFIHSHYSGLLSVFSVSDIFGIAQMYKSEKIKNVDTFVMGLVTASGTQYLMVIDDAAMFDTFAKNLFMGNTIDQTALEFHEDVYDKIYGINPQNNGRLNEKFFTDYLVTAKTGLKILKGTPDMNKWSPLNRGTVGKATETPCP